MKNSIDNDIIKKQVFETVKSVLLETKFLKLNEKKIKKLYVEFGYLFLDENDKPVTLLKAIIPGGFFKRKKIYYFGTYNNTLILMNNNFNEDKFIEARDNMYKNLNMNM